VICDIVFGPLNSFGLDAMIRGYRILGTQKVGQFWASLANFQIQEKECGEDVTACFLRSYCVLERSTQSHGFCSCPFIRGRSRNMLSRCVESSVSAHHIDDCGYSTSYKQKSLELFCRLSPLLDTCIQHLQSRRSNGSEIFISPSFVEKHITMLTVCFQIPSSRKLCRFWKNTKRHT
jgi:hypothetical protein